jgi:carbon-monoxide dehydrogenase medium subunit
VEQYLLGKELTDATCKEAGSIAAHEVRPIDDVRASAEYRRKITSVIVRRGLSALLSDSWSGDMPDQPVSLVFSQNLPMLSRQIFHGAGDEIVAMINGKEYRFNHVQGKSLLRLLRDDGLLVGTKEGCTEGECGACTVWMDGAAVMSCLVPAPRAHGANIVTIEGLAPDGVLHPIQKAFVNEGAVQCGYCTPGFLMAGAALMKEKETPNRAEIIQAFTGNLCRCTGYYKIIQAVEKAYEKGGGDE